MCRGFSGEGFKKWKKIWGVVRDEVWMKFMFNEDVGFGYLVFVLGNKCFGIC